MKKDRPKLKVFVAMSGGVDSSVAAALLKKAGYNVVGVFFKPWSPSGDEMYCDWKKDRADAMRVAAQLGIAFKTWDFSRQYGRSVAKYMINSYKKGLTPNPDVMCNKEIKFGLFLNKALAEGADMIATGHYVRLQKHFSKKSKQPTFQLMKGADVNKDQSYFLWTLTQKQLKYCLFPIGDIIKPQVRMLAKKFGLPVHNKKDSQGVCFVGQLNIKDFLKKYIPTKEGNVILTETGNILGRHDGAYYYTIGQRHGMDIKNGGGPYFVSAKDIKNNVLYVTTIPPCDLKGKEIAVRDVNWIMGEPKFPLATQVKIRYRTASLPAEIKKSALAGNLRIMFRKPAIAITPGQSAVIYQKNKVLGGGIIT